MWCIFHVDVDVDVLNLESALSHVVEESGVAFDLVNHAVLFCFYFTVLPGGDTLVSR